MLGGPRFVKRLYVPLPNKSGRRQLMNILLKTSPSSLTPKDVEEVVDKTEGTVLTAPPSLPPSLLPCLPALMLNAPWYS